MLVLLLPPGKTLSWHHMPNGAKEFAALATRLGYGSRSFLSRRKDEFPARYRLEGSGHRRVRLLSATEIRKIRGYVIRGWLPRQIRSAP